MNFEEMKALSPDKQKELFDNLSKIRAVGKQTNYASQYSAGPATIARTAKVSEKVGKKLHAGYWKLNWSIKKIAESTTVKKTSFGMFQKNPVNGFWYSLRSDKDRVSTLIQGLGSYILDVWLLNIFNLAEQRSLEVMLLGQFHKQHCGFAQ